MMRYWVRVARKIRGPYTLEELAAQGAQDSTLVCPERRNYRDRWNWAPASTFARRLAAGATAAPAPAPRAAAAGLRDALKARWRRPPVAPLVAAAAALIIGSGIWMKFSFLPRVRQTYIQVHTSMDLAALAILQERTRRQTGSYANANDLAALAGAAGDPRLPDKLAQDLDLQTLLVRGTSSHFVLEANSLDEKRTLIGLKASTPVRPGQDRAHRAP
jgi:hypothetical protein